MIDSASTRSYYIGKFVHKKKGHGMRLHRIGIVTALGAAILAVAVPASATVSARHESKVPVVLHFAYRTGPLTATATVTAKVLPSRVKSFRAAVNAKFTSRAVTVKVVQPDVFPGGGGTNYENVDCHKAYAWGVAQGTFTYTHGCGYHTSPWGWHFNAATCATMITEADESGMLWVRNGIQMSDQSPHIYPCTDQFHGNFNPLNDGDDLSFLDIYTYDVDIDGEVGAATLDVYGAIHQTSTYGS